MGEKFQNYKYKEESKVNAQKPEKNRAVPYSHTEQPKMCVLHKQKNYLLINYSVNKYVYMNK
jgi:hypothetical protein